MQRIFRDSTVFIIAVIFCGFFWSDVASALNLSNFSIDFMNSTIIFDPSGGPANARVAGAAVIPVTDWEIKKVDDRHFHLRRNNWADYFLNADITTHRVYKVEGGTFGAPGKEGALIKEIMCDFGTPPGGNEKAGPVFMLDFMRSYLIYDPGAGTLKYASGEIELVGKEDLEATCFDSQMRDLCQIRYRKWEKNFWEVSLKEKQVWWAQDGKFGSSDGRRQNISFAARLKVEQYEPVVGVFEDLGFTEHNETRRPKSEWIESRKALFRDVLKHDSYDILIAPFQVQGYAVDRAGRSLMARYLADRIAGATNLRTPDPTLVARALGEDARTIDEEEIYRLANDLKVRILVRCSVGHDRDEKLKLTMLVQQSEGDRYSADTKATRFDWKDVPFSDEHPPEEAFNNLVEEIAVRLPLKVAAKSPLPVNNREKDIPFPGKLADILACGPVSPVTGAGYLQFLGMLYPEDTTSKEHLFERSLVILNRISPKSPDYPLLKARALFYLHRRPAALAALGTPSAAQEKALLALLNGNLPELKNAVVGIKESLWKTIAQIELNDLRRSYKERVGVDDSGWLHKQFPKWGMLLDRRLQAGDPWYSQNNLEIKQQMDTVFPIPDFTADELLRSKMALAGSPLEDTDMELSVHEHYRRILESGGKGLWPDNGRQYPVKGDALDLLYAVGESNALRGIEIAIYNQGLEKEAIEQLNRYDRVYRGHPAMTYLRGSALANQWKGKKELEYLLKERDTLNYNAYFWSGGQVNFHYAHNFQLYDADYPSRPFWQTYKGDRTVLKGDRIIDSIKSGPTEKVSLYSDLTLSHLKNMAISLKYTHDNFYILKSYYEQLLHLQTPRNDLADALLEESGKRFAGNPERIQFYAKLNGKTDDPLQRVKVLEEAIAAAPDVWKTYEELGNFHMSRGEFKEAQEVFLKYPLFREGIERDRVEMSNEALGAALNLRWRGAIDESVPLFRIAANSDTGSGAEMMSAAILAVTDGDYPKAASHYLRLIKRYQDDQGYRDYMTSLHLMGYHQESWSIFNTIDIQTNSPSVWTSAFIGQRMEAKTGDDIARWLAQDHFNNVDALFIGNYMLMSRLMDRAPEQKLPDMIRTTMKGLKKPPEEYTSEFYRPNASMFAEGYFNAKTGNYDKAHEIFKQWITYLGYPRSDFAVPYRVWCGVKAKRIAEIDDFFNALEAEYAKSPDAGPKKAYYFISRAYYHGLKGNHKEATANLALAKNCLHPTGERPIYPWYQLVDACEWLYKDTGYDGYRLLALEWAKLHQRILPWFAWAYAVEAKYTASEEDRLRALAITLYLDKNSERIADIPETEKAKARKWLEKNNPFLKYRENPVDKSAA
jgi:hypothetical protein